MVMCFLLLLLELYNKILFVITALLKSEMNNNQNH